jgi:acetyl-CoA/propionyl-CoA carboxylase biotin carboxyl carrier protein
VPGRGRLEVDARPIGGEWNVRIGGGDLRRCRLVDEGVIVDGQAFRLASHRAGRVAHVAIGGESWAIAEVVRRTAGGDETAHADGTVRSPMPGTVIAVTVAPGDAVVHGLPVAIVEAMKMEHTLVAPFDGVVAEVLVANGSRVALDQPLLTVRGPVAAAP